MSLPYDTGAAPQTPGGKKPRGGLPTWVWILLIFVVLGPIGIVAISIVAAIAIPSLLAARIEANQGRANAELQVIGTAIQAYVELEGDYPESLADLIRPDASGAKYLDCATIPTDPWGRPYQYALPGEFAAEALVYTFGMDGEPGGELEGEDLVFTVPE